MQAGDKCCVPRSRTERNEQRSLGSSRKDVLKRWWEAAASLPRRTLVEFMPFDFTSAAALYDNPLATNSTRVEWFAQAVGLSNKALDENGLAMYLSNHFAPRLAG
jgi:hypothetical protein